MKSYPSIPNHNANKIPIGQSCYGFYKYDGSNLRWEWNKKQGWYKFGTRTRLFGADETPYNQAIPIFKEDIGPVILERVLQQYNLTDFIVYTEFFGPSSFAGSHDENEQKELKLIDVWIPRKGFIPPKQFIKMFDDQPWAPEVVYQGNLNKKLIEDVRAGVYPLDEGMMCKGLENNGQQWMVKIKTQAYLDKLKNKIGEGWEKFI